MHAGVRWCVSQIRCVQVIKTPVTRHLPPNSRRIGFSHSAPAVAPILTYVQSLPEDACPVFVLGAFAHGKIDHSYCDDLISISRYPLSAAYAIGRITNALEQKWDIV